MPCYSGSYSNLLRFLKMKWRSPQKSSRKFTYIYLKVGIRNHKIILILVFVLGCRVITAQVAAGGNIPLELKLPSKNSFSTLSVNQEKTLNVSVNYNSLLRSASGIKQNNSSFSLQPVPKNHYVEGFAFFCRQELQVEKKLKIPVRIRVGSLEQCNILEQKQGW